MSLLIWNCKSRPAQKRHLHLASKLHFDPENLHSFDKVTPNPVNRHTSGVTVNPKNLHQHWVQLFSMNSTVQNFLDIDYSQASAVFPPRVLSKNKRRLEQLSVQILELEQKIEKKLRKQNPKYGELIQKKTCWSTRIIRRIRQIY